MVLTPETCLHSSYPPLTIWKRRRSSRSEGRSTTVLFDSADDTNPDLGDLNQPWMELTHGSTSTAWKWISPPLQSGLNAFLVDGLCTCVGTDQISGSVCRVLLLLEKEVASKNKDPIRDGSHTAWGEWQDPQRTVWKLCHCGHEGPWGYRSILRQSGAPKLQVTWPPPRTSSQSKPLLCWWTVQKGRGRCFCCMKHTCTHTLAHLHSQSSRHSQTLTHIQAHIHTHTHTQELSWIIYY